MSDEDEKARGAAAYMSGVLQAAYDKGNVSEYSVKLANKYLKEAGMGHCRIEDNEEQ